MSPASTDPPGSTDPLLAIADELFGLSLGEFTPARDGRAKELKGEDRDLAARVKALRKPSVAAWAVNLLVRRESEQVEQVLAVGAALRAAQENLDGEELRALTRQRRQLTAAVTHRARALAAEEGTRLTEAVATQVEATLTAAMVDETAAAAVRSGLLVAALSATGVDVVDVAAAVACPDALGFAATPRGTAAAEPPPEPDLHVVPDPEADLKARRAAEERLATAEAAHATARAELEEARGDVADLEARGLELQARLDELRRDVADTEARLEAAEDELGDAEEAAGEAERAVRAAADDERAARDALARLS